MSQQCPCTRLTPCSHLSCLALTFHSQLITPTASTLVHATLFGSASQMPAQWPLYFTAQPDSSFQNRHHFSSQNSPCCVVEGQVYTRHPQLYGQLALLTVWPHLLILSFPLSLFWWYCSLLHPRCTKHNPASTLEPSVPSAWNAVPWDVLLTPLSLLPNIYSGVTLSEGALGILSYVCVHLLTVLLPSCQP